MYVKNNHGSTLVNVVLCILFISMMGVILVGSTINNVKVQQKQKQEDDAFYNCETAMNEIMTSIRQYVTESIQQSYLEALKWYTQKESDVLNEDYNNNCVSYLNAKIETLSGAVLSDKLKNCVSTHPGCVTVTGASFETFELEEENYAKKHAKIKGLQVTFQRAKTNPAEKDKRAVTITTDLVIKFPKLNMGTLPTVASVTMPELEFLKYAIIAEGGITYKGATDSLSSITGNLYAGQNGILTQGINAKPKLLLSSRDIILKGNLQADNQAMIQVYSMDGITKPNLWANSIVTTASNRNTIYPTQIDLQANCFIQDDMNLEAVNSWVNVDGNYFGYTNSMEESGSCILMNGVNSTLKVSGNILALGGYAYIGFTQKYLSGKNKLPVAFNSSEDTKKGEILTSDSIGIKSNQLMYLIGSDCFINDSSGYNRSNPIPYILCKDILDSDNLDNQAKIFEIIDQAKLEEKYKLTAGSYYVLPVLYKTKNADSTDTESIVYFYICFNGNPGVNPSAATDTQVTAVKDFVKDNGWSEAFAKDFKLNEISLNSTNMYSAGYLYEYEKVTTSSPTPTTTVTQTNLQGQTNVHSFSELPVTITTDVGLSEEVKVADLQGQYINLTKTLFKTEPTGLDPSITNPYDYLVKDSFSDYDQKMKEDYSNADSTGTYRYHVVLTNGNYTVTNPECGIIVATGNVAVNANFEGLIIAKGEVSLGDGVNVTYHPEKVKELITHIPASVKGNVFNIALPDAGTTSSSSSTSETRIGLDALVTYSNWHKG